MKPAALFPALGEHLADPGPEPERAVPDRQGRGRHATAFTAAQQIGPRLGRFPVAVSERDQLLAAVGADADHDQQTQLLLLQAHLEVDAVDPHVHIVGGDVAVGEGCGFFLPLGSESADGGRRQPSAGTEELLECRPEIAGGQSMQVQQRQDRGDLRAFACPRRQNLRREPLPLTGVWVDALVVDPRCLHRNRTRSGHHLPLVVGAVTHHQTVPVLIDLIGELVDVGGDLGAQCRGEHLPSTVSDDLIEDGAVLASRVGTFVGVDYREHEACLSASAATLT